MLVIGLNPSKLRMLNCSQEMGLTEDCDQACSKIKNLLYGVHFGPLSYFDLPFFTYPARDSHVPIPALRLTLQPLEDRTTPVAGTMDTSFGGGDGIVKFNLPGFFTVDARGVAVQPDGKTVIAGRANSSSDNHAIVYRLNIDGTLDTTFSGDGFTTTQFGGATAHFDAVALQPDGKIVATGTVRFGGQFTVVTARFNPDGSSDLLFGTNGFVSTDFTVQEEHGQRVLVQPDGKVVVVGNANGIAFLLRYTTAGVLDTELQPGRSVPVPDRRRRGVLPRRRSAAGRQDRRRRPRVPDRVPGPRAPACPGERGRDARQLLRRGRLHRHPDPGRWTSPKGTGSPSCPTAGSRPSGPAWSAAASTSPPATWLTGRSTPHSTRTGASSSSTSPKPRAASCTRSPPTTRGGSWPRGIRPSRTTAWSCGSARTAPRTPDFGVGNFRLKPGVVFTHAGGGEEIYDLTILPNGRIVTAGKSDGNLVAIRYFGENDLAVADQYTTSEDTPLSVGASRGDG